MIGPPNGHAVVFLLRVRLHAGGIFGGCLRAPVLIGVLVEDLAVEFVGARLRDRSDGCSRQLVVFGLVVLRDDLVLADAKLRERIAARRILAGDATLQHVVLLADAVDVDVDRACRLRAALQLRRAVAGIDAERDAGNDIRELEEVARDLRNRVDDLLRDGPADFGRLHVRQRIGDDDDAFERCRDRFSAFEIQRRGLRDRQRDHLRCAARDLHGVGAGREARHRIAAIAGGRDAANEPGIGVGCGDFGAGIGLAAQRRTGALRQRRHRAGSKATRERAREQFGLRSNRTRTTCEHHLRITPQVRLLNGMLVLCDVR